MIGSGIGLQDAKESAAGTSERSLSSSGVIQGHGIHSSGRSGAAAAMLWAGGAACLLGEIPNKVSLA